LVQQNVKEVSVKHSDRIAVTSSPLRRQRGFVFKLVHSLLTVAIVVALVVSYKAGYLSFLKRVPGHLRDFFELDNREWDRERANRRDDYDQNDATYTQASHREIRDPVERGNEDSSYVEDFRYTVQLAAGYDSRQLYAWRDSLIADGYDASLVSLNSTRGMTFKLRVGSYRNREDAEAMRDRLRRRYPTNFADSFIIQGN
jgi:hypothetical protein